jgi:hypothetical protein
MRRTGALVAVTLLLLASLGTAARRDAMVVASPPSDGTMAAADGVAPDRPVLSTEDVRERESTGAPETGLLILPRSEDRSGELTTAASTERPAAGSAVASQRPALTAVLDPSAGATLVASGSAVAGSGPMHRYTVEVEATLGLDVDLVRTIVEDALHDEVRSWARTRTLQRVDDPRLARIRIVLASPETVDAICATVGLNTAGIYSCWTGRIAALNGWRWEVGATGFADVATYRTYLINHEFGHALGHGHIGCPGAGSLAPVMMQQSKGLAGCTANGWPYP